MTDTSTSLWKRNSDFRNLWLGLTASFFGSKITAIAVPLIASVMLNASPMEMGLLVAAEYFPYLLISLFAGVWLDRRPKRTTLIVSDVLRALLLCLIPVSYLTGFLSIPSLLIISLLIGFCTVVSDIGSNSYLPFLVKRDDLVEGNSKLELSDSASDIGGNALGGTLIQAISAPFALFINGVAYVLSAFFTFRIKHRETPQPKPENGGNSIWVDIKEGLATVFQHKIIRRLVSATVIFNFFTLIIEPIFLIFVLRTLEIPPFYIGLIFASTGVGALVGALLAGRASKKFGLGPTMLGALVLAGIAALLIPTATLMPVWLAIILIVVMQFTDAVMVIIYNVNQRSLRAALTPKRLQGRVNASIRMVVMGVAPIGALTGGLLGGLFGTLPVLIGGAIGVLLAGLPLLAPTVRSIREIPELVDDDLEPEPAK